jgi:hypothetical protein
LKNDEIVKQNPIIKNNSNETNINKKNKDQIWHKKLKDDEIKNSIS